MLYEQTALSRTSRNSAETQDWHIDVARDIIFALRGRDEFPCPFSQLAVRNENLVFAFVEDKSRASLLRTLDDLSDYLSRASHWDGNIATAEPLLMAFNPAHFHADNVDGYNAIGWAMLQLWHEFDPSPWPDRVPPDPNSPFWSMCFRGTQIFVNMSNPAHKLRRSRNLGRALTFVINPRERFDRIAGDNPQGRKVRAHIRERIEAFDLIPHSPVLGTYQAGDLEWRQYGLSETNELRADRCPFHNQSLTSGAESSTSQDENSSPHFNGYSGRKSA